MVRPLIRGGVPVYSRDRKILGVVVVDYFVPKSITKRALQISRSYEEYKHLPILKQQLKRTYILTLFLITLVIIFSATWFGLYLAKGITVPIQKLAEGTREVSQGNWDYRIDASGDDEIGTLVDSFNQMTRDLKQINLELDQRLMFELVIEEDFGVNINPDVFVFVNILLISIPMMVFAVTVQIIIATVTRSFKETQTYLGLLPLIPSVPGMVLVFVAVSPHLWIMTIPFFSQVVLIGQLVRGDPVSMANAAVSVGSTLLLSVAMLFLAGRLYSREQLLFSA